MGRLQSTVWHFEHWSVCLIAYTPEGLGQIGPLESFLTLVRLSLDSFSLNCWHVPNVR